jgi:23S rRNA pseudouridine2605 synthase
MRLNRFLATCGLGSRRSSEALIAEGRVQVNGQTVDTPAVVVTPGQDEVRVDGKLVSAPRKHTYYLLHKPEGVVTTAQDPEGRLTVIQLVPSSPRVFPVGRLDRDTSGALLLTDDGDLAHQILHPRFRIDKEYEAVVEGTVEEKAIHAIRSGMVLEGESRPTAPAQVEILERRPRRTQIRLILHEGRKRQIRRMLEKVGHPVIHLRRIRIGPILLDKLQPGECRPLTTAEVTALQKSVQVRRSRPPRKRRGKTS